MAKVSLFNSQLGVNSFLPVARDNHLPKAQELITAKQPDVKLDELYQPSSMASAIDASLQPKVDNEELLQPNNYNASLESASEKLAQIKDGDIRRFLRDELNPLMENKSMLNSYMRMMGMA